MSFLVLPDLDSNQDILNQNQLYYPYTIRHPSVPFGMGCKNKVCNHRIQIF